MALPALWAGKDGQTVLGLMIDAVSSIAPVHATFARVCLPGEATSVPLLKTGHRPPEQGIPPQWEAFARACDDMQAGSQRSAVLASPLGPLRVFMLQMGAGRQEAHVWFGSRNDDFPSASHSAFLRTAVSLAAAGVAAARSEYARAQAQRAKDEFLAMLGHELRNPLAPIVTTLGLIRIKGSGQLAREHEVIERQVGHLSRLVDDLLDITRITRDRVELRREVFEVRRAVVEAVEGVSPLLEERQHEVSVDIEGESRIDADPDRIRQVLSNLLINAAKYTPPGGCIRVRAGVVKGAVEIGVEDNGTGIDQALLSRVFDLFEQGPTTIDRARGGLGIGLAIVKKLVALHGGTISAHSEGQGKGSLFVLRLPLADTVAAEGGGQAASADVAPKGQRVLLVDDNADALDTMEALLSMSGYEVATARDPAEALRKAPAFRADAYVLDIGLPGIDGYQLAAELRRTGGEGAAAARFIALTGYGQASDKARAAQAGFHQHLVKPVDVEDLLAALTA